MTAVAPSLRSVLLSSASPAFIYSGDSAQAGSTLALDFTTPFTLASQGITLTRASGATYFDSTGTMQTAANNAVRFDYNPATLALNGLLREEARTNGIRNNTMVGAAAGTPGTLPTNWVNNVPNGLTVNVIGTGTENGITYIDIQWTGTTSGGTTIVLSFETNSAIAAVQNQTFTTSFYVKLVGGSLTNITALQVGGFDYTAATGFINTHAVTVASPTAAALATQRVSAPWTISDATAAFMRPFIGFVCNTSSAVNMTIRIGLPQNELGASATSAITTTGAAATRAAEDVSMPVGAWFSGATLPGTLAAEYLPAFAGSPINAQFAASLDDGTASNRYSLRSRAAGTSVAMALVTAAGVGTSSGTLTTDVAGTVTKLAIGWDGSTSQNSTANAGTIHATSSAAPGSLTTLNLGGTAAGSSLNGWLQRVRYWPRMLSNAELQQATT